jgi:hypothetical protein
MEMRNLPIGVQDFADLRERKCVYVDKTAWITPLTRTGKHYFLCRPRRFGKSLFLSTLRYYFQGRKDLFDDTAGRTPLAIAAAETEWTAHPVLHFDWNAGNYRTVADLESVLDGNLRRFEEVWGSDDADTTIPLRFASLIRRAVEKTGQKAVVLIDEYDKPLLANIEKGEINEEVRAALKAFYGVLKSADEHLRFAFLTGVTKFSKVSIFSDLNQLQDISMEDGFSGVCGITETELVAVFDNEIRALAEEQEMDYDAALEKLRRIYNGYHFSVKSESVYNPFGLLNALSSKNFMHYWFSTGTPTFLVTALKKMRFDIPNLIDGFPYSLQGIFDYRLESGNPVPLLYQSGYLTIKGYDALTDRLLLGFPNEEVKYGFLDHLLCGYVPKPPDMLGLYGYTFIDDLRAEDIDGFLRRIGVLLANVPYGAEKPDEHFFQSMVFLAFTMLGQYAQTEAHILTGRLDCALFFDGTVYVFEFKAGPTDKLDAAVKEALAQIDEKNYAAPYNAAKKVVKIGAAFSTQDAGELRWEIVR